MLYFAVQDAVVFLKERRCANILSRDRRRIQQSLARRSFTCTIYGFIAGAKSVFDTNTSVCSFVNTLPTANCLLGSAALVALLTVVKDVPAVGVQQHDLILLLLSLAVLV